MNDFNKKERLINYHLIKKLLNFKNVFYVDNISVSFCTHNITYLNKIQILISVPKKKLNHLLKEIKSRD